MIIWQRCKFCLPCFSSDCFVWRVFFTLIKMKPAFEPSGPVGRCFSPVSIHQMQIWRTTWSVPGILESKANQALVFCIDNAPPEKSCFIVDLVCFVSCSLRICVFLNATKTFLGKHCQNETSKPDQPCCHAACPRHRPRGLPCLHSVFSLKQLEYFYSPWIKCHICSSLEVTP